MQAESEKNNEETVIDLGELFLQLLKGWYLILIVSVICAAIFFIASKFIMKPQYQSTAKLYILSKSTSVTSLADIQLGSNLTNDYMQVVGSRPVLDQVISNLEINLSYKELSQMIHLENPSNTRILSITVTDTSAERAKYIVDEIANVSAAYISQKMDQDPPSILQYGYSDGLKVSPNTVRNTISGFFIGFIISVTLILVSFLINDGINDPQDVEKILGIPLLGSLPYEGESDTARAKKKRKFGKKTENAE